jgi:hypothetical protein
MKQGGTLWRQRGGRYVSHVGRRADHWSIGLKKQKIGTRYQRVQCQDRHAGEERRGMTSAVFEALKLEIQRSPLSIYTIAAKSRVHDITIRYWLSGRTNIARSDTMEKVASAIGKRLELSKGASG